MKADQLIDIASILYRIVDALRLQEALQDLHDCNDCPKLRSCRYAPRWGERTRINCPLWGPEEDAG